MEREEIKEIIQKKIEHCNNILELKKILFQASQEIFGLKNTTGIRKEIKEALGAGIEYYEIKLVHDLMEGE